MIRKIKDTETQKKKERSNVTGIKEVKAIKEKIRAIKAGIKAVSYTHLTLPTTSRV